MASAWLAFRLWCAAARSTRQTRQIGSRVSAPGSVGHALDTCIGHQQPSHLTEKAANGVRRNGELHKRRCPAKSGLHVNFSDQSEVKKSREKFLTAKYGSHQMSLIRKRLAVEMWLYDELQKLYDIPASKTGNTEVDVDLDHLLDMDDDNQRRKHLQEILVDAKKSPLDVKKFVEDLLERAKTL
ncbi:Hypothetical predicted protein [Cloeon dipterum]|uniref:Protein phosphatase 1 regulatory subunit 14B n=1 Tax=Cloeon dipterum TaxID=197152 RepID=A0A8S1D8L0_9INSE|nr:Hypothetical predicted protein [Cloeon dipterum]